MIKIDTEKLDASVGLIVNTMNGSTMEVMRETASVLMPMEGQNALIDANIADCRKFQANFNTWTDSMKKVINEIGKTIDIEAYRNRMDVASVQGHETDFNADEIDADAVLQ